MNILFDKLPTKLQIFNKEYEINYDFRTSLRFEELVNNVEISEDEIFNNAIKLYFGFIPKDNEIKIEMINQILWFYKCGEDDSNIKSSNSKSNSPIYSFKYDAEYIYAAFLSQYNIDLQSSNIHWWEFKSMFMSLNEENIIVKIMGYRSMEIPSDMTKKEKEFYKKMKETYKLPTNQSKNITDKINNIENSLMNGGDITHLL